MNLHFTRTPVLNRGRPPESFLCELVEWGRDADADIFAPNPNPKDIYALTRDALGPWAGVDPQMRRAGMLEVMRVHAGFESSWNWSEGVDRTNKSSMAHIEGQETGIFQVSFDSTQIGDYAMLPFAKENEIATPAKFISAMKCNHRLALSYYARLVRISVAWAGPLLSRKLLPELSRDAMIEFEALLA